MEFEDFKKKYYYNQLTSMMQQYLDIKFANLDSLLLFRLGDFYELFFEDAVNASKILGITLTKRGKSGDQDIPMCGVPYHSLENYLNKLIDQGYKVAICEQLESPEEAKKRGGHKAIVERNVVRIFTPGTIIEESLIATNTPNYLMSVVQGKSYNGICYIDLSTSEIYVTLVPQETTLDEVFRLQPKEILISESLQYTYMSDDLLKLGYRLSYQVESFFDFSRCERVILDFYQISNTLSIGELSNEQVISLGSVLEYLCLTQKNYLPKIPIPKIVNYYKFMSIDSATRKSLELTKRLSGDSKGSLLDILDYTLTKSGSRLLYKILSSPLIDILEIESRLNVTEAFLKNIELTSRVRELLKNVDDIERCLTRVSMNKSSPRDLLSIKNTIVFALKIADEIESFFNFKTPESLLNIKEGLKHNEKVFDLINQAIREDAPTSIDSGGVIKPQFNSKVKDLQDLINNSQFYIEDLKSMYKLETGIENLKILYNNIWGFFIEISSKNDHKIDIKKFIYRQKTTNTTRYTTRDLQKLQDKISSAKDELINLEFNLYQQVCLIVSQNTSSLRELANNINFIDVFCTFAYIAHIHNFSRPILSDDLVFRIIEGRHIVVEYYLKEKGKVFVSNDCKFSSNNRVLLITGPNMSGKSTFLRQNAIISILAQIGSFVPATYAEIGIIDKIFTRIGSGDDLFKGQSTFMLEMVETSSILAQSTAKSLIILDEVGRGTSTYDGLAIAWSVLEYIHNQIRCKCLFSTHYYELTNISNTLSSVKNYTVSVQEQNDVILFLYNVIEGISNKSYGIHVAELAGLPLKIINRAKEILDELEMKNIKLENCAYKNDYKENINLKMLNKEMIVNEIEKVNPDLLSPKEALEIVYKLKDIWTNF